MDERLDFGRLGRRFVEPEFGGRDLSSEGGALLLRRMDAQLVLSTAAARALGDERLLGKCRRRFKSEPPGVRQKTWTG